MHCVWQSITLDISLAEYVGVGAGVFVGVEVVVGPAAAKAMAVPNKRKMDLEMATMFRRVVVREGRGEEWKGRVS